MTFLKPDGGPLTIEDVDRKVAELIDAGAWHKRRGFRLRGMYASVMTNRMLEEAVELQAECMNGTRAGQIREAADVLGVLLHLWQAFGISLPEVCEQTLQNLRENFTTNAADIETTNPGPLRSNRQ